MLRPVAGLLLALAVVALTATQARAYAVDPATSLEELARSSDLVIKATVVSQKAVTDPWFEPVMGYEARAVEIKIVSVIKGATKAKVLEFRHYASVPGVGRSYSPQAYDLTVGRTYIVFASNGGSGVIRQINKRHTQKGDQGVLLAADARRHRGKTITEVALVELRGLLASKSDADAVAAIQQLDAMSGGGRSDLKDFDRAVVLAAIRPKIRATSDAVAIAAIGVFATDSPYHDDRLAQFWLAGLGKGEISGIGPMKLPAKPLADGATKELLAVATGTGSTAVRALAIRALGRSHVMTAAQLTAWANDPDVELRRAAVLVSAELSDRTLIKAAVADRAGEVRHAAALAIGYTQDASLLPLLGTLVTDKDPKVDSAAALSLLSFAIDQAAPTLKAKLTTPWKPLFVNALAQKDPAPYLADLAEVIAKKLSPDRYWGGTIPAGVSWTILFGYALARPPAELTAGKHDRWLDALEKMDWFSSSEPRKLYALYLVRGLTPRAKKFRDAMRKNKTGYNIDYYFDMADKDPSTYLP
jgi:hypothetical protein